jgi:YidC/Oxa1 family membrane protein insertase
MPLWNGAVELLREAIFAYAQVSHGNLAMGIIGVTFLARMAMLPLTLRVSRAASAHQEAMRRVQPELDAARARFRNDPRRAAEQTRRILAREGLSMVPAGGCVGALVQAPVLLALFSAVRQAAAAGGSFLWIRDISMPNLLLAGIVTALTTASMSVGVQSPGPSKVLLAALPAMLTMIALSKMAAGIGLYWGVSSAIGIGQGLLVRRLQGRR